MFVAAAFPLVFDCFLVWRVFPGSLAAVGGGGFLALC